MRLLFGIILITLNISVNCQVYKLPSDLTVRKVTELIDSTNHNDSIYVIYFYFKPPHTEFTFFDSAIVITGGSHVQITNAQDSVFVVGEEGTINGDTVISYLKGDTALILIKGGYNVHTSVFGYGNTITDWDVHTARKRNGLVTYGNQIIPFTTTGANNQNGASVAFYNEYEVGDKVWLVVTRKSGTGNLTITSCSWNIQTYYLEK